MGGSDDNSNLVALTPEEHFLAHVLLVKMHPEHTGLILAVNQMCQGHKGKRQRRKLYGWLKRRFSVAQRHHQTGKKNSQYGKKWITNGPETKKIGKEDDIPMGWWKGREGSTQTKRKKCAICEVDIGPTSTVCVVHNNTIKPKRKSTLYSREHEFLVQYKKFGSINKALIHMGFEGAVGNFFYDAKELIRSAPPGVF